MKKASLVVTLLLFGASLAYGQRDGLPPFGATEVHDIDVIDLGNLVPIFHIPLPNGLSIESPQSCHAVSQGGGNYSTDCGATSGSLAGFYFTNPSLELIGLQAVNAQITTAPCFSNTVATLVGKDGGTAYSIPSTTLYLSSTCGQTSATVTSNDQRGITVTLSYNGAAVGSPYPVNSANNRSGWTWTKSTGKLTDPFGNSDTYVAPGGSNGSFTNTLGAVTTLGNGTNTFPEPSSYAYTDTSSNTQTVSLVNGTATTFQPLGTCTTGAGGSVTPISSISFPDSTSISFTWDTNNGGIDGMIKSVTLRTGGTITYTYGSLNLPCTAGWQFSSLSRATPDGTTNYTLSYSSGLTTTTVLDPGKNKTVYTLISNAYLQSVYRYQNTGTLASPVYTLISNTSYCYNTVCGGSTLPTPPITTYEIKQYVGIGSTFMSDETQTFDSTYGNLLTDATTDEITSQTITKTIVYGSWNGTTCVALGNTKVQNHPCTVTTKNGTTQLAYETFTYNSNGAPTASTGWISSTDTLTTNYTANSTGTMATKTLPNTQLITYTYGNCNSLLPTDITTTVNSVAIDNKMTWNCDAAVVVDTTDPNSNEDDTTYDSMNRISTYSDNLGNVTSYAYGSPTLDHVKITDPLSVVSYQYVDGLGRPTNSQVCQTTGCSNLDTVSKSYAWNGTNFETKTYVPCVKTTLNSACTTVALTADSNPVFGPVSTTDANSGTLTWARNSKAFSLTAGPAPSGENTKVIQAEVDGFGRTTSTCALETSGGTTCGQTMGNSGILTSNVYSFDATTGAPKIVATRGSQSHTLIADALGRTTSITLPETGSTAQTITYDSQSTSDYCTAGSRTSYGDAIRTNLPDGTSYVCYVYDGLHRPTDVGDSGQSSTSPCKRFRYDSTANKWKTAPTGYPSSGANIIGRLMETATDTCVTPSTTLTDEWFAYDKDGNMTDMWESTPNSGGYYHTTATYDADGNVLTLSGIPSTSTLTLTMDGEGRPFNSEVGTTWIVGSSSTTGVSYDAASRPLTIPIAGTTNSDTYVWDNVGNMTKYTFASGSTTMVGQLTWNSIGSLRELNITDGFNSGGTQDCKYGTATVIGYDDVGRLLDANCGSLIQHDSWTYDQYDNATRTGNPGTSWSPGYSSTNNHYSTSASYDSNGNVTYDGVNSYSFNNYGQMAGVRTGNNTVTCGTNGNCPVYDAFGRIVEIDYGSSSQLEMLLSPVGRVAYMSGQTVNTLYIPQPGGGLLYANGGTNYFIHPDWLGTKRLATKLSNGTQYYDTAFTPYGESYDTFGTLSITDFTGLTNDTFGNLFDTGRELFTNASRWNSPDPAHAGWNAYAYVTDPNTQTDPGGLGPNDPVPGGRCVLCRIFDAIFGGTPTPENDARAARASAGFAPPTSDLLSFRDKPHNNHPFVNGHQYVSGDISIAGGSEPQGWDFVSQFFFGSKRRNLQNDLYLSSIGSTGMSIGMVTPAGGGFLLNPNEAAGVIDSLIGTRFTFGTRFQAGQGIGMAEDGAWYYRKMFYHLSEVAKGEEGPGLVQPATRAINMMRGVGSPIDAVTNEMNHLDIHNAIIEAGGGLVEHFNSLGPQYEVLTSGEARAWYRLHGGYIYGINPLPPGWPIGPSD